MFKIFTLLLVAAVTSSITVAEPQYPNYDTEESLFATGPSSESQQELPRDKDFDCIGNWTLLCTQSKKMGKNGCPGVEKVKEFVFEECQLNNLFSKPLMDCCTCYEPGQERCANPIPF